NAERSGRFYYDCFFVGHLHDSAANFALRSEVDIIDDLLACFIGIFTYALHGCSANKRVNVVQRDQMSLAEGFIHRRGTLRFQPDDTRLGTFVLEDRTHSPGETTPTDR